MSRAKRILSALALVACATATQAANIVWVSDYGTEGFTGPSIGSNYVDEAYIVLLQNAGHTVKRFNGPNAQGTVLTPAYISALNTNDLIILGRHPASAAWQSPQVTNWNASITKPLINCNAYLVRASRLGWTTGSTVPDGTPTPLNALDLANPKTAFIFEGVAMNGNLTASPYDEAKHYNTSQIVEGPVAGGTVIANASFTDRGGTARSNVPIIMEWPAGTAVRGGADILGGYRLYFATGTREPGSGPAGYENLTATGESLFLRAVGLALNNGVVPAMQPVGITTQPTAKISQEAFGQFQLSCTYTGFYSSIQWFKDNALITDPFALSTVYVKTNAQPADSGKYYVVLSNSINTVTSTVADVNIYINPIVITQQPPANLTVVTLRPINLKVGITGTTPTFQWYRKAGDLLTAIEGATKATFSVTNASLSDAGDYLVVISNPVNTVTSTVTHITISEDSVPPVALRAVGNASNDKILLEFNEIMDPTTGNDPFNFQVTPPLEVFAATLLPNQSAVLLTTGPQTPDTEYSIQVVVADVSMNQLETNITFRSWTPNLSAGILFEVYGGLATGPAIGSLTNSAIFPNQPTETMILTNMDTDSGWKTLANTEPRRSYYGGRIRTLFFPPLSGQWRFFLMSDDNGLLYLNTNGPLASGKMLIASESASSSIYREPEVAQTSAPFDLIAGRGYYLEAIFKENSGSDGLRVAARMEGDATVATNLTALNGSMIGLPNIPAGISGVASLISEPASVSVESKSTVVFSAKGSNSIGAPFTYQWQKDDGSGNFANIPGANRSELVLANVAAETDNNTKYRCIVASGDSSATSSVATLTVLPDTSGPAIALATRMAGLTNIVITFSEPLDAATANNAGNYRLCNVAAPNDCITVQSAILTNNTQVILITDLSDAKSGYQLTITNVTDLAGNAVNATNATVKLGPVKSVVWVADNGPAGFSDPMPGAADDGFINLLQRNGYSVLRYNGPDSQNTALPQADLDRMNACDLIMVARASGSTPYQAPQASDWNIRITKPMINCNSYLIRDVRLGWTTGGTLPDGGPTYLTALNLTNPKTAYLFGAVAMNGNMTANLYDEALGRNTSQIVESPVAGGVILATASYIDPAGAAQNNIPVIMEWPAGTMVRGGADALGSYRLYFAAGAREPASGGAYGQENLTATGEALFLRAVALAINNGVPPVAAGVQITAVKDAGGNIVLTWPVTPGYSLYQADAVTGAYSLVPGNPAGTYTVPKPLESKKFFVLRNP